MARWRIRELDRAELARPAVVFAPHPDDETLGCGGTILRKRSVGAPVTLAFVTDGSGSHADVVPRDALRAIREQEALRAARVLGVEPDRVKLLGYRDGALWRRRHAALEHVTKLLEETRPQQVFVPYAHDGPPDHEATYRIVCCALRRANARATLLAYPVGFWNHWPWVGLDAIAGTKPRVVRDHCLAGTRLLRDFRWGVRIDEVAERKWRALEQHATQVVRLDLAPRWPTLTDLSGGDFLQCFFGDYELFSRVEG